MNSLEKSNGVTLETIITGAVKIPGVKVDRNKLLGELFANEAVNLQDIIDNGPIACGVERDTLDRIGKKLILNRTSLSSIASFTAGIPGGFAMAATVPADVMQFFGMTLRLAQELSYLYGAGDLWQGGELDDEKVKNQLMLYCGVMFGVSGAVSGVRVLSVQLSKTALKKIPQKALTKTFWYPIFKKMASSIGVKVTKTTVAKGASKVIPVAGGVISGGLNFVSMMPMAKRLQNVLDKTCFDYSDEEFENDCAVIEGAAEIPDEETVSLKEKATGMFKNIGSGVSKAAGKVGSGIAGLANKSKGEDPLEKIEKLFEMKEAGIISEEEYEKKRIELLERI